MRVFSGVRRSLSRWRWTGTGQSPTNIEPVWVERMVRPLQQGQNLYERWKQDVEYESDEQRLANAASVFRWGQGAVLKELQGLSPPESLRPLHELAVKAIALAVKGGHLLSSGYRFHNLERICDGSALLEESAALHLRAMAEAERLARAAGIRL